MDEAVATTEPDIIDAKLAGDQSRMDKCVDRVVTRFKRYRDCAERKEFERKSWASYKAYHGWKAHPEHYVRRMIFRQIETLIPQLTDVLLAEQLFDFMPRLDGFDDDAAGATAIVHDQIDRYGSRAQLHAFVRGYVMWGTAYNMPHWCKFKHVARKMERMDPPEEKTWWKRETNEMVMEAPVAEYIPWWDCFVDPGVEEAKDSPLVIIKKGVSADHLKTLIREGFIDANAVRGAIDPAKGGSEGSYRSSEPSGNPAQMLGYGGDDFDFLDEDEGIHEMLTCWDQNGRIYVVLDQKHLLRASATEDGKIPIVTLRNYPQAQEHFGIGEISTIIEDQAFMNELTELYRQQQFFGLPMYTVPFAEKENFHAAVFKPGGSILVNQPGSIGLLPQPASPASMVLSQSVGWVEEGASLTSGITPQVGGSGAETKTATGIVRLQNAAQKRFEYKITIAIPAFREIYQWLYDLNARHNNEVYAMRIEGKDGGNVFAHYPPTVFEPNIDVYVEIGGGVGIEQANGWLNGYKVIGQDPLVNRQPLIDEFLRASGVKRIKRFRASSANALGDALLEDQQLMQTGVIADPKPGDDHQTHFTSQSQFEQTPQFQMLLPEIQARHRDHVAQHQTFLQQEQQSNAQAQQAQTTPQGPGATGAGPEANQRAQAMMDMAQTGRNQNQPQNGAAA